jgi:hypothetical protein
MPLTDSRSPPTHAFSNGKGSSDSSTPSLRSVRLPPLIDATKHPQIQAHPTICQTALQIAAVLTKEMMGTPTISLAMMSLMQTRAKDDSPDMSAPRAALLKRLEEVAAKDWLVVLRESAGN